MVSMVVELVVEGNVDIGHATTRPSIAGRMVRLHITVLHAGTNARDMWTMPLLTTSVVEAIVFVIPRNEVLLRVGLK